MVNVVKFKIHRNRGRAGTVAHYITRLSEEVENTKGIVSAAETKDGKVKLSWTSMDIATRMYLATALLEEIKQGMYE